MATMEFVIEGLEEQHPQPLVKKAVLSLSSVLVAPPEILHKFRVITQPALALDEIEKHEAVEKLEGIPMSPGLILGLAKKVLLKNLSRSLLIPKKLVSNLFNIEGVIMGLLDVKWRDK